MSPPSDFLTRFRGAIARAVEKDLGPTDGPKRLIGTISICAEVISADGSRNTVILHPLSDDRSDVRSLISATAAALEITGYLGP